MKKEVRYGLMETNGIWKQRDRKRIQKENV